MDDQRIVEPDSRHRISLGDLAQHKRYLVRVEDDGTIILTPAVVMPAVQARRMDEFLDAPETGARRGRPGRQPR